MRWQYQSDTPFHSLLPFLEQDHGGGGNDGDEPEHDDAQPGGEQGSGHQKPDKTLTQSEVDAIIEKRLNRARKQWEKELEDEKKKAQMDEAERLKAEKAEAESNAQARIDAANNRAKKAEAKAVAAELGVKPERIQYAVRLIDLDDIEVDENGEPDSEAIKAALSQVTTDMPELIGGKTSTGAGGSNPPNGQPAPTRNPWSKEHFNLTEQGRILRDDPALAERLKATAKG